jgi:hypothetical protein
MVEKFAPLSENSPQRFGHRKHKLPERHLEAEDAGDPVAGLTDFPLMAAWAEVPRLAGEGEEALVAAIGALEPGESGGKVTAAMELSDDGYGVVVEWPVDGAVAFLVACFEVGPAAVDELPQR